MSQSLRGLLAYRTGRAALPAPAWAAASAAGAGVRELAGQREVDIAAVAVEHNLPSTSNSASTISEARILAATELIDRTARNWDQPARTAAGRPGEHPRVLGRETSTGGAGGSRPASNQGDRRCAASGREGTATEQELRALIVLGRGQRTDFKAAMTGRGRLRASECRPGE